MGLTHIAGQVIIVGGIRRQRCVWCGALIQEDDLANMARSLEPGEDPDTPWEPPSWTPGALINITGTFPVIRQLVDPGEPNEDGSWDMPEGTCMGLSNEITI